MTNRHNRSIRRDQHGAVLFIALIMLVVLSLVGIASMQVTTLQERMAGNYYTQSRAFEYAEWMTRVWENNIQTSVSGGGTFSANDIACPSTYNGAGSADAWAANKVATSVGGTLPVQGTNPGDMVTGSWFTRRIDQCTPGQSSLKWGQPTNENAGTAIFQVLGADNDGPVSTSNADATSVSVVETVYIP